MQRGWEALAILLRLHILFRCLTISLSVVLVLTPTQKNGRGKAGLLFRVLAVTLVMLSLSVAITLVIGHWALPGFFHAQSDFLRSLIVIVGYTLLLCPYSRQVKCVMAGSILAAVSVCVDMSYSFSFLSGQDKVAVAAGYGILLLFALFVRRFSIADMPDFPRFGAVLFVAVNSLVIFMTLVTQTLDTVLLIPSVYSMVVYLSLLILLFVCHLSMYFLCIERNKTYRLKTENQMVRAAADQMSLSRTNLEELRKIRHDLNNAYVYMSALLREERYNDLAEALKSLSPVNLTPEFYVDCGNHDISAILTAAAAKAGACGIRLQHTLTVPPVLPFEGAELFSLLSNLIENAIDANVRYGLTDDITVQISLREEYLYICVTNRLPPEADQERLLQLKTQKEDPEEHGLGTQIVRRLAEKYNGYFLADIQDSRFVAEVLIDMMYEKGEGGK